MIKILQPLLTLDFAWPCTLLDYTRARAVSSGPGSLAAVAFAYADTENDGDLQQNLPAHREDRGDGFVVVSMAVVSTWIEWIALVAEHVAQWILVPPVSSG